MGRPSDYTPEIASAICARIAEGEPLRQVCRDGGMPAQSTVYLWLQRHGEFSEQYARAREAMMDRFADEILEIADDSTNDWIERENRDGSKYEAPDTEHIQRSKLRIESRQWLMGKCAPKKYGDKQTLEHTGKVTVDWVRD